MEHLRRQSAQSRGLKIILGTENTVFDLEKEKKKSCLKKV